jgi:uncharacterized protein (DUF362 family)
LSDNSSVSSRVAVVFAQPNTVLDDYERLFDLAQVDSLLRPGTPTILKDNISWHFPMPAANTTPWQLEGTILGLRHRGYDSLVCVQNKTVVIDAFRGEDLNGYRPIFERYGVPVLYNFRDSDMNWIAYRPQSKMMALDHVYPEGIFLPDFFVGRNIVHLPTVKCHMYTTTTGAMKNAFGGLLSQHRHYTHSWIHETLVDLLAIQKEIHPGMLAVMDGTTAGNGPGPRSLEPAVKNVLLASGDQVAIDAVAAKLMGFNPLSIPYIRMAHERGLGVGDPRLIEVVGDDIGDQDWGFEVGYNLHRLLAWFAWYGPTRVLQKLILRTRLVALPIFLSEFNHDYVQWPLRQRHIYQTWLEQTGWGQLFQAYQQEGTLAPDQPWERVDLSHPLPA